MKISERRIEMDIMKTIMLKNKEPNERLRTMIKFETTAKLSKRILIIKSDNCIKIDCENSYSFFYMQLIIYMW